MEEKMKCKCRVCGKTFDDNLSNECPNCFGECEICHKLFLKAESPSELECPSCYEAMEEVCNALNLY
jgi:DNA-directed RNA polymerase subunit RPC12/RpoP